MSRNEKLLYIFCLLFLTALLSIGLIFINSEKNDQMIMDENGNLIKVEKIMSAKQKVGIALTAISGFGFVVFLYKVIFTLKPNKNIHSGYDYHNLYLGDDGFAYIAK
jgi:hypothetical protein